ncbi:MAG: hypothetical protein ACOZNI_09930 [Myxococcota bacterium]
MKKFRIPFTTVFAESTTAVGIPVTGWFEAEDFGRLGFDLELRAKTGVLEVALGYETADNEDTPDTAVAVTSYRTANGFTFRGSLTDISATTAGKRLIRIVFLVKLTSGSTLALGRAGGAAYVVKRS